MVRSEILALYPFFCDSPMGAHPRPSTKHMSNYCMFWRQSALMWRIQLIYLSDFLNIPFQQLFTLLVNVKRKKKSSTWKFWARSVWQEMLPDGQRGGEMWWWPKVVASQRVMGGWEVAELHWQWGCWDPWDGGLLFQWSEGLALLAVRLPWS